MLENETIKQIQHRRAHRFNVKAPPNQKGKPADVGQQILHYLNEFIDHNGHTMCSTSPAAYKYIYKGGNIETDTSGKGSGLLR
jgi:hypothetical protein